MPPKKQSNPVISANASAKVEAVAKATYEHKKTITEIIPPDVTRAKNNAWLDLISPLTEWAGLKGDELRFKRTQLRLQREDVLSKIVERARDKIMYKGQIEKPIPNKFLIPFLEQASLEDLDSSLVDMWASLLASAAKTYSSHHIHFVSIISQLSPKQGVILKSLIGTENAYECELGMDAIHEAFQSRSIRRTIQEDVAGTETDDEFAGSICAVLEQVGISVVHSSFENKYTRAYYDVVFDYMSYEDEDQVDYSILEAVGLIKKVDTNFFDVAKWSVTIVYYHLTDLGFHFAKACGVVRDSSPPQ